MKSGFKGSIFKTKHTLYFGNETSNPVGYLRSGGTGISYLCNQDPNIQVLHTRPHYILVMLLEDSRAVYRDESGFSCPLAYGDFLSLSSSITGRA